MTRGIRAALVAGIAGCVSPEQRLVDVHWLDRAEFDAAVQPVLAARCASPPCHGRPERALSIYAALRWRADPRRLSVDEPLSDSELAHNYITSCLFAGAADPGEAPALTRKALGDRAGVFHGGGAVFDDASDPDYEALASWIGR